MSKFFVGRESRNERTLASVIYEFGEERRSRRIARAIVRSWALFVVLTAWSVMAQIPDFSQWVYRASGPAGFYPVGTLGNGASTSYYLNGSVGTVCNKLVKLDALGKAIVTAGGETSGVVGVAVADPAHGATCGTTGSVAVAFAGQVPILFDTASPAVGDYVSISSGSGLVADAGAGPGSGQNIGRIIRKPDGSPPSSCNSTATCYVQLQLGSASGGGAGCGGGCVLLNPGGDQTVTQPGGTKFIILGGNLVVQAGGAINGIFGPDSGANAQTNGTDNTWQIASGTAPVTQSLPPGGNFLPVYAPKVSGIVYPSVLESQANRNQVNGYAGLNVNGQVDLAQLIAAAVLGGCGSANFVKRDFSGCASSSSNPPFTNVTGGTNNTAAMVVDTGASLTHVNNGVIDASTVNTVVYPTNSASPGGLGADNRILQTVGPGNLSAVDLPPCTGSSFLQHNNTLHTFPCNAPAGTVAPVYLTCNGVNGVCPDTSPYTGLGAVAILQSFTLAGNTITPGRCAHVIAWVQHPTGTASITYNWNIGGTGARGAAPTGGVNASNQSTNSTSNFQQLEVHLCAGTPTTVTNWVRQPQMQTGSGQVAGAVSTPAIDWTISQQINLTFNVANTDTDAFNGGYVSF